MRTSIIEIENLSFRYDQRIEHETLSELSISIETGEWVAIVGNNGSGKSTLAQILVGLLVPQSGRVTVAGIEMANETKWEIRKHIGLVFQNPDNQFVGTTVQDDIAFGLENLNMPFDKMKKRVDEALEMVEMIDYRLHDPSRLSGGQKQRVALAGILALRPSIIVLDEALVMLDPKSRRQLLTTLRNLNQSENITIISITHDMNEAAAADRIVVMKSGQIKNNGKPSDIFTQEKELESPFAEQLRRELAKRNNQAPSLYMTEDEMVRWLCK